MILIRFSFYATWQQRATKSLIFHMLNLMLVILFLIICKALTEICKSSTFEPYSLREPQASDVGISVFYLHLKLIND